jgi:hypothetical protein
MVTMMRDSDLGACPNGPLALPYKSRTPGALLLWETKVIGDVD